MATSDLSLITMVREEVMKTKDYSMQVEAEFEVQYPTGFLNLDYLNGQVVHVNDPENGRVFDYDSIGIVDGSINMFIGRPGCGKSTIIKQMAANIIRPFNKGVIFEDSIEGGIVDRRDEILTRFEPSTMNNKIRKRNAGVSIETFYKTIKMVHDLKTNNPDTFKYDTGKFDSRGERIYKFQPTVYILDSLAMLMPEKNTQEEELSGQMSATASARLIAGTMRRIVPICKAANIIVFIVNHITTKIEINSFVHTKSQNMYLKQDETTPGGVTPFYVCNNVFRLDDNTKLSEEKELGVAGNHVLITMVKSRTNRAGSFTDMIFNQDIGFDSELSLFTMLKDQGRIKGAGAYLYIGDHSEMKFAQKNFKAKLADPQFCQVFVDECYDALHKSLIKDQIVALENGTTVDVTGMIMNKIQNPTFIQQMPASAYCIYNWFGCTV